MARPPTADDKPSTRGRTAATRTVCGGARPARGVVTLLATVLAAFGLIFGAGPAAIASVAAASETAAEETAADEETVTGRRLAEIEHRLRRTPGRRRARRTRQSARRPLRSLPRLVVPTRCTPSRGPPLLAD